MVIMQILTAVTEYGDMSNSYLLIEIIKGHGQWEYFILFVPLTMASNVDILSLGDEFESYNELEKKVKEFEELKFVKLWKRDAKTIAGSKKRCPNKSFNEQIKYTYINYACVHGGRDFKSYKSTGARQNTTYRQQSTFNIKIKATEDGERLKVVNSH